MEASSDKTPSTNEKDPPVIDVDKENLKEPSSSVEGETVEEDKKGGTKRSYVWDHFTKDNATNKAKCSHCNKWLAADTKRNGTTALRNHLTLSCTKSPFYKQIDKSKQSTLCFKPKGLGEGSDTLASHKFSQEKCRILLAQMCIKDNRPFSVVEDEGFREFVWELNPMFKFPSRWTVARDCMKIYKEERKKLKSLLKDQMVSLTTDTWTSVQNFNYMCLTAHWIDDDWVLRKKILNFCQISNHRAETIGRLVYRCLEQWGIDRVFTVTVDNASSNDGAIRFLKRMLKGPHSVMDCKFLHLRCNAHIINLVVKDGLGEQFGSIAKIRNAVRYLRSSSPRFQSFKDCVEREKIECRRKPCLDVDTRWNSTFLMLETALKFEKAFERLQEVDSSYRLYFHGEVIDEENTRMSRKRKKSDKVVGAPDENDFENARLFMEFLRLFFNVTKKISGSKYATANLVFVEVCKLHASITSMSLSVDEKKKAMGESAEALICAQDWLRSTPSDLQDCGIHGHQLEEYVENLERIEDDLLNGKKTHKDSTNGDDEDWD